MFMVLIIVKLAKVLDQMIHNSMVVSQLEENYLIEQKCSDPLPG